MKKLILTCLFFFFSSSAYAGLGFYVNIKNMTNHQVTINNGGNDNWKCEDFCSTQILEPNQEKVFYSEERIYNYHGGIQGIDINFGSIIHHVEFWTGDHSYSVSQNIRSIYGKGNRYAFVGTSTTKIATLIEFKRDVGYYGTIYITLSLHD